MPSPTVVRMVGTTSLGRRLNAALESEKSGEAGGGEVLALVDALDTAERRECALLMHRRTCLRGDPAVERALGHLARGRSSAGRRPRRTC